MNTGTLPTSTGRTDDSNLKSHVVCLALLVACAILVYAPVLLHPHWGTFDDPSLILQSGRRLMDDPSTLTYILAAQMRMGIFYWVTVLWRIFPENAGGFFATNCCLISLALVFTYCSSFVTSRRRAVSMAMALTPLASPSLFEVIYTLDKQEVYFPFLFSAVIFLHLVAFNCKRIYLPFLATAASLLASACYLSKETGAALCLVSGAFLATNLVWPERSRTEVAFRLGILFLAVLAPFLYFKYSLFPVIVDKYIVVTFDLHKLLAKTWHYALVVPDFFYLTFATTLGALKMLTDRSVNKRCVEWCAFISLTATSLAATLALISFDTFAGVLVYIWLPIYFILLPATAFFVGKLLDGSRNNLIRVLAAVYIILLLTQIPTRFLQAQFQYSFDSMSGELARVLADISKRASSPTIGALPTYSVGETEIPEQIETLVRSQLAQRYYETKDEKISNQKFTMLNYLSPVCTNLHSPDDPPDTYRLSEFRGRSLTYRNECGPDYVGWTGFQILNGATPFQEWIKRPFGQNNLLIVPYGEAAPDTILYRGAATFAHPWQAKILNFPQLTFEDIGHVERKLTYIGHHRQTIGWRILRVKAAQPVSFTTSSDGWLRADGKIFCKQLDGKPRLQMISTQQCAQAFIVEDDKNMRALAMPQRQGSTSALTLEVQAKPGVQVLQLRPIGADTDRFHIDSAEYTDAANLDNQTLSLPYLFKTPDGWLIQNGLIIYGEQQARKNLIIKTLKHSASLLLTDAQQTNQLTVKNGQLSIPLAQGKPLTNGLFYLQLSSASPLSSSTEKRQLLIHCDSQSVE